MECEAFDFEPHETRRQFASRTGPAKRILREHHVDQIGDGLRQLGPLLPNVGGLCFAMQRGNSAGSSVFQGACQ